MKLFALIVIEIYTIKKDNKNKYGGFSLTGKMSDCESEEQGSSPEFTQNCPSDVKTKQVEYPVLDTGVLGVQISSWVLFTL